MKQEYCSSSHSECWSVESQGKEYKRYSISYEKRETNTIRHTHSVEENVMIDGALRNPKNDQHPLERLLHYELNREGDHVSITRKVHKPLPSEVTDSFCDLPEHIKKVFEKK